jgi:hypothetical protein
MREPDRALAEEQARIQDGLAIDLEIRRLIGSRVELRRPARSNADGVLRAYDGTRAWVGKSICWLGAGCVIESIGPSRLDDESHTER